MAMAERGNVLVGLNTVAELTSLAPPGFHRVVGGASITGGGRPTWTEAQQSRLSGLCGPAQWVHLTCFIAAEAALRVTVPSKFLTNLSSVVPWT